jgi:hypothetical protein
MIRVGLGPALSDPAEAGRASAAPAPPSLYVSFPTTETPYYADPAFTSGASRVRSLARFELDDTPGTP